MKKLIVLAALLVIPVVAQAQTAPPQYPLLSAERLAAAVGANYAWHSGNEDAIPPFAKEVEVGAYLSYSLTSYQDASGAWKPRLILTGSSLYGLDNKSFHTSIGIRLPIFVGGDK